MSSEQFDVMRRPRFRVIASHKHIRHKRRDLRIATTIQMLGPEVEFVAHQLIDALDQAGCTRKAIDTYLIHWLQPQLDELPSAMILTRYGWRFRAERTHAQ